MASTSHGSSCRCPQCRAQRAMSTHTATPAQSASRPRTQPVPLAPPAPIKPTSEERAVIEQDPLTFILVMRESGASVHEIRSKLLNAEQDITETGADELMAQADALYQADRRGRGVRRIQKGVALTAGGLIATIPLALFGGIFVLGGIVLTLVGVVQLGIGIHEIRDVKE